MLKEITLEFTESGEIKIPAKGITIFVGPNNSGKSLVLREVEAAFEVHPFPPGLKVLRDYEIFWPTEQELNSTVANMKSLSDPNLAVDHVTLGRINAIHGRQITNVSLPSLKAIATAQSDKRWMATQLLRWGVVRLDGRSRFNLTNDQSGHDLLGPAQNVLMHLFQDEKMRKKVRALVKEAFGLTFVIDPTNLGHLRIRLAKQDALKDEQSLNAKARKFHAEALHIKDASDGVQAFTGIVTAVCAGDFHTILVDEPEAFLHPPLARKLGKNLARLAIERGGTLMASTHSSDFLMGCVESSSEVRIVRLEYNDGKSSARSIDPKDLETFFKSPLMRSANVISGLFHDGVVICESDNDRAFYGEIYHRLLSENPNFPSLLFVNAQNKQTIKDMMGPLRQFGVPAAAIPDIDLVKDGGSTWSDWLRSARVPDALHLGYGQQRAAINSALVATGKDMKRDGGVELLGRSDKAAANEFFDRLEEYGVFAVRRGELEDWLPKLGVAGKKTDWTVSMLERLGSDPADANYVGPDTGDVWEFLRRIVVWISNSSRKGMDIE